MSPTDSTQADVLVIGSGPGGAITADRLAVAGYDVVVCEEGPWIEHGSVPQFSLEQMSLQYRGAGLTAALGRPPIAYAEGRCAGGGSEINSGLYHRPPEAMLHQWARTFDIQHLTMDALEPHCAELETALDVSTGASAPRASQLLAEGARRLDWSATEVPRWYTDGTAQEAGRRTMTRTYLPRARSAGARILTGWRARKIVFTGSQATGCEFEVYSERGRSTRHVNARTIVIACGAIHSAALLQRSGIRHHVGTTLQMHPTIKLVAGFSEAVPFDDVPVHQVKEFAPDLSFGGSASSDGQIALALSDDWPTRSAAMDHAEQLVVYYAAIRPQGLGRVLAVPGVADPLVTYRLTTRDMHLLAQGLRRLALLCFRAGATRVWPSVSRAPGARSEAEIPAMTNAMSRARTSLMTVHVFSSIRMGEAADCAVDSFGRVKGPRGVYVNDASLLPTAPGVNPQGSIMAIASRNAGRWIDSGELKRA